VELVFSDESLNDLRAIRDFIALDFTERADDFIAQMLSQIESAIDNPFRFRKSIYVEDDRYRDMVFRGYTIVIRVDETVVIVLAVFRARNYESR
jgi:plasmid stabilization system protein ParE